MNPNAKNLLVQGGGGGACGCDGSCGCGDAARGGSTQDRVAELEQARSEIDRQLAELRS